MSILSKYHNNESIRSFSLVLGYFPSWIRDSLTLTMCNSESSVSRGNRFCIIPRKFFDWLIFSLRASNSALAALMSIWLRLDFVIKPLSAVFSSYICWLILGSLFVSILMIFWVVFLRDDESLRFKRTKSFHPKDIMLGTGLSSNFGNVIFLAHNLKYFAE